MKKNDDAIAIYSRKSKDTGKGESIGNQVELCRKYIRAHYGDDATHRIVVYEDEGFSGGNLNRPAFQRMMDAVKKQELSSIIVYRLDRISRNVSDFSSLIEELSRLHISFVSVKEQFDTSTPMGRAMMYIASVFSQLERETIAERIRDNMHELAKTGRWLGGVTPTGYASEGTFHMSIDGKSKKVCKLKLIPQEGELIKTIYELYLETDSLTLTEASLIQQGLRTKNQRYFTRFSIKAILQNPVYMIADDEAYRYFIQNEADLFSEKADFDGVHGVMAYNRTRQEKGKSTKYLPPSQWVVAVGKHPGLISGRTWTKVQKSLQQNQSKSYRKPRNNEAFLTGLLFCQCGERMYPKTLRRKSDEHGEPQNSYTYVCKMKERSRRCICDVKNASGNALDQAVMEQIKALSHDQSAFLRGLKQSRSLSTENPMDYEKRLNVMKKEASETEKKINSLVDSLSEMANSLAKASVTKRIQQLSQKSQALEQQILKLKETASQRALSDREFHLSCQLLSEFQSSAEEMTLQQKRAAARALLHRVVWDGDNAHVFFFGTQSSHL